MRAGVLWCHALCASDVWCCTATLDEFLSVVRNYTDIFALTSDLELSSSLSGGNLPPDLATILPQLTSFGLNSTELAGSLPAGNCSCLQVECLPLLRLSRSPLDSCALQSGPTSLQTLRTFRSQTTRQ